jgi:hypothetical protein
MVVAVMDLKAIQAVTGKSVGMKRVDVMWPVSMNKAPN